MPFCAGDGVLYMMIGDKHANHLVVSLWSLRQSGYDGPVAIVAGDAAGERWARACAGDERLGQIIVRTWNAPSRRSSGTTGIQYANKTMMGEMSPFERTVFLDADTVIQPRVDPGVGARGWIDDLLPDNEQVRLTRFSTWTTSRIANRIEPWRQCMPREVTLMLSVQYPAINTGVIGFSKRSSRFMKAWRETTLKRPSFICDEIAAQLIFVAYPHVVMPDAYNASVKYSDGPDERVVVWHGHGFKFHRTERGRRIWTPHYESAMQANVAGIQDWTDKVQKSPRAFALAREAAEERDDGGDEDV